MESENSPFLSPAAPLPDFPIHLRIWSPRILSKGCSIPLWQPPSPQTLYSSRDKSFPRCVCCIYLPNSVLNRERHLHSHPQNREFPAGACFPVSEREPQIFHPGTAKACSLLQSLPLMAGRVQGKSPAQSPLSCISPYPVPLHSMHFPGYPSRPFLSAEAFRGCNKIHTQAPRAHKPPVRAPADSR